MDCADSANGAVISAQCVRQTWRLHHLSSRGVESRNSCQFFAFANCKSDRSLRSLLATSVLSIARHVCTSLEYLPTGGLVVQMAENNVGALSAYCVRQRPSSGCPHLWRCATIRSDAASAAHLTNRVHESQLELARRMRLLRSSCRLALRPGSNLAEHCRRFAVLGRIAASCAKQTHG